MTATPQRKPRTGPSRRAHLRVVREPRRRHLTMFLLVALLLAGGTVFATVSLNAMAAGDAVRARTLEADVAEAERRYGHLVAEVASLENPERVRRAAIQLGMVPATAPEYLVLERNLPADRRQQQQAVAPGETTDALKPVLSQER